MSDQVRSAISPGLRHVLMAAGIVVVIAGLKASADLMIPVIFALFLALLCIPPMRRLQAHGVPGWLSIVIVVFAATLLVLLVAAVIGQSITQFQDALPYYRERLDTIVRDAITWLNAKGVNVEADEIVSKIDTGSIMQLVGDTASSLLATLSNLLLILLTMVFMLLEAHAFPAKLRRALGRPDADLTDFSLAAERVQKYLAIKAWVSLATGACASLLCFALGVDFPLFWGLIAFLFNFVPNIGSIIAAVPVALLALIQLGLTEALFVAAGYFAINMVIGNFLEPRVMGRQLGLSTLVVFLSMLFWGWVWGPVGMLLSVPLTVIVKIALEHSVDFKWVAVLLGPSDEHLPADESQSESTADDAGTMPSS